MGLLGRRAFLIPIGITILSILVAYSNCAPATLPVDAITQKSVATLCRPGSQYSCQINNGTGLQVCNSSGSGAIPNTCMPVSCNSGFNAQGPFCVANVCPPNTTNNP